MDFRSNEDYYWRSRGYGATLGNGLYNGTHSTNINWAASVTEPVTLNDVKAWGKIDTTAENSLLTALITTARIMCEQYTNTGFISRSIVADINNANGGFILPYGPVTVAPTAVDWQGTVLVVLYNFNQLQTPYGRMAVTYTAGYSALPEIYKTAIMEQVLFLYENRGDIKVASGMSVQTQLILNPLIRQK